MPFVPLTITNQGYAAAFASNRRGPRIDVRSFKVAAYATDYVPNASATALLGTTLYEGPVLDIKKNKRGDIIYRCTVPDSSSPGSIYEFGLYLADGTLFAIGVLPSRYAKTTPFQLRIYGYLRVPNNNRSVEFEAANLPEIPVVDNYRNLIAANISGANAYVVVNGHSFDTVAAPTMVCKWGCGDEWALVGGSCVYRGFASSSQNSITFDGLTVQNLDYAMVSVLDGPSRYQCRALLVDEQSFVLDHPFTTDLDNTVVRVWAGAGICGGQPTTESPPL